jgi:hypothetical protein
MARAYDARAGTGLEVREVAGLLAGGGNGAGCAELRGCILSTSLSDRKSDSLRFRILRPVATSSRTVGKPSRIVTRCFVDSSRIISSKNGA